MTNQRQNKWQPIQKPVSIPVNWAFSKSDYDKMLAGFDARSMDDKWDIAFSDDTMHFYRSWTGYQVYGFSIKNHGDNYTVDSFEVEQDSTRYVRTDDKQDIKWLTLILKNVVGVVPNEQ
jgi:hypothetical protein